MTPTGRRARIAVTEFAVLRRSADRSAGRIVPVDSASEITNYNIEQRQFGREPGDTDEHVRNNRDVHPLRGRGITPELLPASEGVKQVERRLTSERKKLPKPG